MIPHLKKIADLRPGMSDAALLGPAMQREDRGKDFTSGNNYYGWYYAIGAAKRPASICEFGVRYGYSIVALSKGAHSAGALPVRVDGWDMNERTNAVARTNLGELGIAKATVYTARMGDIDLLSTDRPAPFHRHYDIVHVDADHTREGIEREIYLAWEAVGDNGWILVDDMGQAAKWVPNTVYKFAAAHGFYTLDLPTLRGMCILWGGKKHTF